MSREFAVVIGMTIAYAASFLGMIFAYVYYRRHERRTGAEQEERHGHVT